MRFRLLATAAAALLFTTATAFAETIFVRTLTGQTITIEIGLDANVAALKDAVSEEAGIPAEEQRLIHAGQLLEDANSLADYGIGHEATLHVVHRLGGE